MPLGQLTNFMSQLPDIIPVDFQVGIQWKNDGGKLCTTLAGSPHKATGKRTVTLQVSSWAGYGGMHTYASLKVGSPWWTEEGSNGRHGGYGGKKAPQLEHISLDVKRVLTKVEKDLNGERVGKIGEETYRFNDKETATAAAIALFKKRFGPGWVLVGEDMGDADDYPVIAETSERKPRKKRKKKLDPKQGTLCTD